MSQTTTDLFYGRVNETAIRFIGGFVALLTIATIASNLLWIPLYLAIDFFFRAFTDIKPPLGLLAKFITEKFQLKPKLTFAPPKKFAAAVGFVFSLTITILLLLNLKVTALITAGVLLICAILESAFGICVGCYVYDWFVAPLKNKFNI
jgi:hypothetical protein